MGSCKITLIKMIIAVYMLWTILKIKEWMKIVVVWKREMVCKETLLTENMFKVNEIWVLLINKYSI